MFRFTIQGRIGRIDQVKDNSEIVRLSIAADRTFDDDDGRWTRTEWLSAVSFDRELNLKLLAELAKGQTVSLEGRIEPRKRTVGDTEVYDHSFVIASFERLSKVAKPSPDPEPQPSAP